MTTFSAGTTCETLLVRCGSSFAKKGSALLKHNVSRAFFDAVVAYAPELNQVEGLWANLKGYELANRCETRLQRLTWVAEAGADRLRAARHLHFASLRHAGLQL